MKKMNLDPNKLEDRMIFVKEFNLFEIKFFHFIRSKNSVSLMVMFLKLPLKCLKMQ